MPNRYYNDFNGKLSAPTPPKDKKGGVEHSDKKRGPNRNTVGFKKVKQYPKSEGI